MIKEFMPSLIDSIDMDLYRFKFRHVISMLIRFNQMRQRSEEGEVEVISVDQMATIHRMANKYLVEYISQQKKEIGGSDYANLIDQLHTAKL